MRYLRPFTLAVALFLSAVPVFAQTTTPAPAPVQSAPAEANPLRPTPEERARFRAAREACVAEVKPRDLPRGERRRAMRGCMEARNPELKPIFARGDARRAALRQDRDSCREEMRGKRLARDERRQAMQTCMVAKRPELAKVFACRDEASKKNLSPGVERRTFMRTCLRA